MVLTPAPHRHELDNTIHATFLYTTARLHPFSMQLPAVQEGQSCPKLFSSDNMYPGSVPAELQGLSQTEEMLIARSCPIMRVIRLKSGQLGSHARPNQLQQKSPTGSLAPAVPVAITPTFSPWTHASDDSYI